MKENYKYEFKTIIERSTVVKMFDATDPVNPVYLYDLEIPIISQNYERDLTGLTDEQKAEAKAESRKEFRLAVKRYIKAYLEGVDSVMPVQVSQTILNLVGKTFSLRTSDLDFE